ncbi:glycosyltransferase family 2 protein [Dyadobacter sp. 3J3]|uniref:glycosyltransferase family 2 protein n=1 Tax=Dyadobacter sp. 3J3 TaxID=2606600 RepID=UPI00135936AB|nr:glycosyltransferase family 2 protein [Dyadobacter sp. 3J3]
MKVSIITVSYNQGEFIRANIESVLSQGYDDVEHIIIDAGSTDETISILKEYPHLNWISEKDKGQSDGLNKGFRKATGDIISWINSDDILTANSLINVTEFLKNNKDEIGVIGDLELIDENGEHLKTIISHSVIYKDMVSKQRGITQGSIFFKRSVFEKIGYLDETLHYAMDFDFFLRVSQIRTIPYINKTLAALRIQSGSKTTNMFVKFRYDHLKIAKKHNASIFSKGVLDDVFFILTNPLRNNTLIRNTIRKIKGMPPWNPSEFN